MPKETARFAIWNWLLLTAVKIHTVIHMVIHTDAAKKFINHLKFNIMKTITIFITMLTVLVFNVNGQNTDVNGLLDNQKTRMEIFNAIAGDHQLMMDFMQVAKENEHSAMMMRNAENHQIKKRTDGR